MSIEVNNESGTAVDEVELVDLARYVLDALRVHPKAELSIVLYDEAAMENIHVQFMDLPGPTDVMSFPMDELRPGRDGEDLTPGLLGDVVLCPTVAARQAREAGHATEEELLLLLTHGILHLLGFDHGEEEEKREMFELQRQLLLTFLAGRGRRSREDAARVADSADARSYDDGVVGGDAAEEGSPEGSPEGEAGR